MSLGSFRRLTFALFSPFAIQFAKSWGLSASFSSFDAITIGSPFSYQSPSLYLGTILIGAGILPQCASKPDSGEQTPPAGILTTLYITSMGMSTAIASSVAVPITKATSWQFGLPRRRPYCALALVIWILTFATTTLPKKDGYYESSSKWYTINMSGLS